MRQAQLIAYRMDSAASTLLKALAQTHGWWLREVQHLTACRNLLNDPGPTVLVLTLGRDLIGELALVHELATTAPDTAAVVLGDSDNPALAALAWDLGAYCVLQPPLPIERLPEIVLRFLSRGEP